MIVLKHVKYKIRSVDEFDGLISLLEETTSAVEGVQLQDILFPKGKEGFLLVFNCETIEIYHEWRKVCPPPPPGATDRYEVFLTRDEYFAE
ncbi:MAG: hypothetical protein COZ12_00070 [Deltaproteobacteria bacterium CG_4_10_14_3_um_filter_60_8]|nr:MAG: hypothetical protein AUK28_00785 [Desulfobacterales bacterium CG2_30_60_27]PIP43404.1 MAG: hypothetical protein COX17_07265 [Deltaproteobacteria bacterium CG23_combo_of_CG06-09_8_20_14_all_60_8]PIY25581.1 MAG: hypothetical protein COZ12_00070 [Deltaproteobacteria bacterium CG_4_10_14_3_um_filter_60_8]